MFEVFGIEVEEVQECFGFFLEVFSYGVLLYGGIVFGFDCFIMFMIGVVFFCDVIVFLKIVLVICFMMEVLLMVVFDQIQEFGICLLRLLGVVEL